MDLSEIKKFEQAEVGTLKLSDAIRVGAPMHQQGTFYYDREAGTTCAMGAAAFGAGWTPESGDMLAFLSRTFPHIPEAIEVKVHGMNACRRIGPEFSYQGIADWLEAQGY
jgi:hypothetical protein